MPLLHHLGLDKRSDLHFTKNEYVRIITSHARLPIALATSRLLEAYYNQYVRVTMQHINIARGLALQLQAYEATSTDIGERFRGTGTEGRRGLRGVPRGRRRR